MRRPSAPIERVVIRDCLEESVEIGARRARHKPTKGQTAAFHCALAYSLEQFLPKPAPSLFPSGSEEVSDPLFRVSAQREDCNEFFPYQADQTRAHGPPRSTQ